MGNRGASTWTCASAGAPYCYGVTGTCRRSVLRQNPKQQATERIEGFFFHSLLSLFRSLSLSPCLFIRYPSLAGPVESGN